MRYATQIEDAYPNDKRVPTHDPCRHRCRSGSGKLRVGRDLRCKALIKDADSKWDKGSPIAFEEGTTAPEMMLFPYMSEPNEFTDTVDIDRGAAMNATMKQIVAANRGIIRTPNQPTYRRLLVEVTHSQKLSQVDCDCCLERVKPFS